MDNPLSSQDTPSKRKKLALGRGLEALIPDTAPGTEPAPGEYFLCDIQLIQPNRFSRAASLWKGNSRSWLNRSAGRESCSR